MTAGVKAGNALQYLLCELNISINRPQAAYEHLHSLQW